MCKLTEGAVRCKVDFQAGERVRAKPALMITSDGRADRFSSPFRPVSSPFQADMSILTLQAKNQNLKKSVGYKSKSCR